ncbi:hypothetical protein [Dyella mobilis]|uniref:DUF1579 domain-containing protein n=1 Tax=Dyella mobilis TaxID=1849582 RepID=A0ABS2KCI3_9GAMM|nr:hypothetical protein [Dyella mobilis]MBM7128895.1 hypothetical protein [Dyella mobilis]GLQ99414.1 hypothetical protein GCM10007863_38340 [Dyella mobilis]
MTLFNRKPAAALMAVSLFAAAMVGVAAGDAPQAAADAVPPGYSTTVTGTTHDFDYFMGSGWVTTQHRLKATGVGSHDWETFPATLCGSPYLNGMATVDEMYAPTKRNSGLTLRTFDPAKRQWSIYWVSSKAGVLETPAMVGGFHGKVGEFYSEDHDTHGRPVKVRFLWTLRDQDHAHWEQAYSYDNRTWETNWTADFVRGDRAELCEDGRPKQIGA